MPPRTRNIPEHTPIPEQTPVPLDSPEPEAEPAIKNPANPEDLTEAPLGNTSSLAEAIVLMTEELRHRDRDGPSRSSGAVNKVRKPDTFDGSDPRKLNNFILLCNLYFRNNPSYILEEPKVTLGLSASTTSALESRGPSIVMS